MRLASVVMVIIVSFWVLPGHASSLLRVHPLYLEETHRPDYTSFAIRDREGFLWIATDNGLKRYDGYNLRIFIHEADNPSSIGSSSIRHLMLQSDGTLWAGGMNLNRYHPETEEFSTYSITNDMTIRAIYEDSEGYFWLGGEGFGLLRFDPKLGVVTDRLYGKNEQERIYAMVQRGSSSSIWVASDVGLFLFNTETHEFSPFPLPIDISPGIETIHGLAEDNDGRLWIANRQGLLVIDPRTDSYRHYSADRGNPSALSTNSIWSVMQDSNNQIWVGTDKNGVHRYLPEIDGFVHFPASANDAYKFPPGAVTHMHEDEDGTIWFSVGFSGMYRISAHVKKFNSFQHSFDSESSLSFNNVLTFHEDRRGDIWIGTDGGGLNRFDPESNRFDHYWHDPNDPQSLSSDAVMAIAEDSRGYIWLGTWSGGLNRLDPTTGKFRRIERDSSVTNGQTLADDHVFRIVVDNDDRLLLAVGRAGLQIYDPSDGSFESYSPLDSNSGGIRSDFINDIERTPRGDYWIAGYRGLELFSPKTKTFSAPDFPITDAIHNLHLDENGYLWVATNRRLIQYNPVANEAGYYTTKDGLSDEYMVSIEQDDLGYLWLGTRNGLNRFDPRTKEVTVFDEFDGLAGSQLNRFSHLKTRDGLMYFGGADGFSYFDPLDMPRNERAPKVHIVDIEINQERQIPVQSVWLDKAINHTEELVLPRSHSDISFTLSATNFIAPSKNMYRYRLYGHNEGWRTVDSSRRVVRYSNLNPGTYQFQVLAANNEGVWAGSAKVLKLTILPAWWQTWWAFSAYALLLLSAMYGFSYLRLHANRMRERQLEMLVSEQTSKVRMANRSIIQLNSELEQRVEHRTRELSLEIEERKESEAKANYIAYHDALTGLYNRAWLLNHLEVLIKSTKERTRFALFFVGGDRFRKINDTYGHLQGDMLLIAAAQRLISALPKGHHAVRLGSDEFTVVIDEIESEQQVIDLAENITDIFKEQFIIEKVRMNLSVSVGFVIGDSSYTEPMQVLRNANIAMQRAKDRGRGVCQMFDEEILQQTLDTAILESDLKLALARDQFKVVFQPIIVVESGAISGFEILLRWHHPERGMVPPDKFISMAESLGLIFDIGLWVLEKACKQLQAWQAEVNPPVLPKISVNLSPVQLDHADFLARVDEIIDDTGVDPDNIKFEITESALMKHTGTVDGLLEALRDRGIELAIDDFGTGYSSLSYLDKLPVQVLKIDRSFINALTDTRSPTAGAHEIVRATIALAHNLNMSVVAEGIETQEQLDALVSYQCDFGQGYFIARPLSPEDATEFLVRHISKDISPHSEP